MSVGSAPANGKVFKKGDQLGGLDGGKLRVYQVLRLSCFSLFVFEMTQDRGVDGRPQKKKGGGGVKNESDRRSIGVENMHS